MFNLMNLSIKILFSSLIPGECFDLDCNIIMQNTAFLYVFTFNITELGSVEE